MAREIMVMEEMTRSDKRNEKGRRKKGQKGDKMREGDAVTKKYIDKKK